MAAGTFLSDIRGVCPTIRSKFRFHDLRHTHATQLLRAGVHPKIVSERLGHSGIGITLDIYSHVLPNIQEEAVHRLDSLLAGLSSTADSTRQKR